VRDEETEFFVSINKEGKGQNDLRPYRIDDGMANYDITYISLPMMEEDKRRMNRY
jgi:hypothetical protein